MTRRHAEGLDRFLKRLQLRSPMGDADVRTVLALPGERIEVPAHRDIVMPGEHVTDATLVVSGIAGRFDQDEDGTRQFTALHIAGDMADLHSAVLPVASWGIEALTDCVVMKVPHTALLAAAASPVLGAALWRDTTTDAGIFAKWAAVNGRKPARARLAHLLCELGMRFELGGLGTRADYPLPLTQAQIADTLGLTGVHVNRTLASLREDEFLSVARGRVRIIDWEALRRAAGFNPDYLQVAAAMDA